jgi:hypothetical protein
MGDQAASQLAQHHLCSAAEFPGWPGLQLDLQAKSTPGPSPGNPEELSRRQRRELTAVWQADGGKRAVVFHKKSKDKGNPIAGPTLQRGELCCFENFIFIHLFKP